ncbi:hypothetical protein DPX39_110103900 [Trypanosoma brucei equiperdum]|uniref:Uncharacterized protein n=1 Tax=Trypanosoma brucei equiperdum TaxID=630700 RepID=A0A3L6KUY5_9TRYP|nr:hypothetical protein DPX39_110103900 [Trypanosoma brucei equiperdum]
MKTEVETKTKTTDVTEAASQHARGSTTGNGFISPLEASQCYRAVCGPCHFENSGCQSHSTLAAAIAHPATTQILQELILFAFTPGRHSGGPQQMGMVNSVMARKPFGVPPEHALTWLDIKRSLLFCGVKQHRCPKALRLLWGSLLALCCNCSQHTIDEKKVPEGTTLDDGSSIQCSSHFPAAEIAILVRHEDFRWVAQLLATGESLGSCTVARGKAVPLEDFVSTIVDLQHHITSTVAESYQVPRSQTKYVLIVDADSFHCCIKRFLAQELRGEHITLSPLPRWNGAQAIVQQRRALVVFCGGTSGCGKSTLSSLISTHLSISTTISTDTIRQALRRTLPGGEFPELFTSTYAVHSNPVASLEGGGNACNGNLDGDGPEHVIAAYEKQCATVLPVLDRTLEKFVSRYQTVVVEGVHLLPDYMHRKMVELQTRGVLCVSFLVYIKKRERHLERFCTRAKSMSLSPTRNKYVSNFENIRVIQQHLLEQAARLDVNLINNTNVDKSLMMVHTRLLDRVHHFNVAPGFQQHVGVGEETSTARAQVGTNSGIDRRDDETEVTSAAHLYNMPYSNVSGKHMLALLLHRRNEKKHRMHNSLFSRCHCCERNSLVTQVRRSRSAESLTTLKLSSLQVCTDEWDGRDNSLLVPHKQSEEPTTNSSECGCITNAMVAGTSLIGIDCQNRNTDADDANVDDYHNPTSMQALEAAHTTRSVRSSSAFTHFAPISPSVRSASADTERLGGRMCKRSRGWAAIQLSISNRAEQGRNENDEEMKSLWGDNFSSETPSLTCC